MFVVPYCDLVFDVVVPADVGGGSSTSSFPVVNAGLLFYVWICVIPVIGLRVFLLLIAAILFFFFKAVVVDTNTHDSFRSARPTPTTNCPFVSPAFGLQAQMPSVRPLAVLRPQENVSICCSTFTFFYICCFYFFFFLFLFFFEIIKSCG